MFWISTSSRGFLPAFRGSRLIRFQVELGISKSRICHRVIKHLFDVAIYLPAFISCFLLLRFFERMAIQWIPPSLMRAIEKRFHAASRSSKRWSLEETATSRFGQKWTMKMSHYWISLGCTCFGFARVTRAARSLEFQTYNPLQSLHRVVLRYLTGSW